MAERTTRSHLKDLIKDLRDQYGITLEHYRIHQSKSFHISIVASAAASLSMSFKTGTSKQLHMIVSYASESKSHIQYMEGGVITATSGTQKTIYNRNRNSSRVSTVLENKSGSYVADNKILQDATVSAGTVLAHHQHWGDKKAGIGRRGSSEWKLALDTVYSFLLTSDDGSKGLHIMLNWYEI